MRRDRALAVALLVAATVALSLGVAGPASAITVNPGEGAVIYNGDLTPIGSELLYGGDPQYLFTTETGDDDYWGFDINGLPANYDGDFDPLATGIPLGFTIELGGVDYDGVVVQENGNLCLTSTTDPGGDPAGSDFECWFYEMPLSLAIGDYTYTAGQARAFISSVGADHYVQDDAPIDTDADTVNDACEYGGYYFADEDVCSSIFWGTTTYEGKPAFVATYFFAPDIETPGDTDVSQILLVDDGDGNARIVINVDRFFNEGYALGDWDGSAGYEACSLVYDGGAGDDSLYAALGASFRSPDNTTGSIDLFGPACANGLAPTGRDDLIDGGASAYNENSRNSTQAGRYILYVTEDLLTLAAPAPAPTGPVLAETGMRVSPVAGPLGFALLGLGTLLLVVSARASRTGSRRPAHRAT